MLAASVIRVIPLVLLSPVLGLTQQKTLFVDCEEKEPPKHVLSTVSLSEDEEWRAYVEVEVTECVHTTRLWVARPNEPYRVVYLMAPKPTARANGMEILGWAKRSSMLLVKTEEWQWGSDAGETQEILAIDAGTGMVHEPELEAMIQSRKDKQCSFHVTDAGFGAGKNVDVLVRAEFSTYYDVDETEQDVPLAKRCDNSEETWRFNLDTGAISQAGDTEPLQLVKRFLPEPRHP